MLVDDGVVVNLMPYSVFKKLGLQDEELIKTNMVLNGFEGKEITEAKGVMYVDLTVRSKTLATLRFGGCHYIVCRADGQKEES